MAKLKELEKRLKDEPDNLGLRVAVAGALFEAGRRRDAAELYHSVAIAYRDQGRPQQAIAVCRSLLELAPDDGACQELLTALTMDAAPAPRLTPAPLPPSEESESESAEADTPPRRSSIDVTPLPAPLAYHEADPSSLSRPKLSRADLPASLQREHALLPELERLEHIEGIANAARQISASLLAGRPPDPSDREEAGSHEETLDVDDVVDVTEAEDGFGPRRARLDPHAALEHLGTLRPTVPLRRPTGGGEASEADDGEAGDDELTLPPKLDAIPHARGVDDEKTRPRERPPGMAPVVASPSERHERTQSKPTMVAAPHRVAELARASRNSRPLVSESRLASRVALSVDPPDPVTEPRNLADRPRQRARPADGTTDTRQVASAAHELVSETQEVVSAPHELVSETHKLVDEPYQPVGEPHELAGEPHELAGELHELAGELHRPVSETHELVSASLDLVSASLDLVSDTHEVVGDARDVPTDTSEVRGNAREVRGDSREVRGDAREGRSDAREGRGDAREVRGDSREVRGDARRKPPSIAPATQATGPLASALFAPVPPASRAAMLQRFRRRLAGIGTTVIRRGEAGHGLILVVRGRLDVHAEGADGARVSLDAIGPGDYVGEIGLVSRTPSAAYVVAAIDSELLVLAAIDFYELAGELPALWTAVTQVAQRRTRDHAQRLQA